MSPSAPAKAIPQDAQSMVTMGRVAGSWGLQGWLKVTPFSEERDALLDYRTWWLRSSDSAPWRAQAVSAARVHGAGLVAQFEGLVVPEEAQKLRGATIGIPRAQLPALAEGEMYLSDLPGLAVVNRAGAALGTVESVLEYGAHPVLRVVSAEGGVRLIPFVGAHVDHVDVAARSVLVDWEEDY